MKTLAATAALLLLAGAAHGQTPPAQTPAPVPAPPTDSLTRDLNSGPPVAAVYLAPAPAPAITPAPSASPILSGSPGSNVALPVSPPARVVPEPASPPSAPPVAAAPPRIAPIPVVPAPQPRTAPITPPTATPAPRAEPLAEPVTPPGAVVAPMATVPLETVVAPAAPPPVAPAMTILDTAARAALPFSADLPPGFEITTGRPGPDFHIYTIRRGSQSFVMVYTGPASQFPIYSGQMVEAGGRASIVATEDGVRHAVEHLFQRPTAPQEIHVWTMSLDGADRAMAEQIAQSIDVR